MSEKHKKNYYGYTEAKKRANEKYNAKFREVLVLRYDAFSALLS